MFSPDVGGPSNAASLRNPRRRVRNVNEDSVKLPKAKRQRSTLRNDTFTPLEDAEVNAITGQANGELAVNGHNHSNPPPPTPASTRQTRSTGSAGLQELAYRPQKKQEKRTERGDGTVTLAKNDFYAVSQLPALPDQIRANGTTSLNAAIASEYGYALALTQTQALVWPYTASTSSPPAKDIFSFTLPYPSRNPDSLPIGTFVSGSPSGQPGLLVITPSSGKITYWEDISNAAVPGLGREKQNGFQASINLLSGETVITIENAEPAGFMMTFSSSRVAHLTVRDPQGRPSVNVQFLRGTGNGASGGGLFGSVRNMFGGGGWRKDVAAVRAGRTRQRGQRDVIIATKYGKFELWDAYWSIGNSMRGEVDAEDAILEALKPTVTGEESRHTLHFQVLDFAYGVEQKDKMELAIAGNTAPTSLVVLVMLADQMSANYHLLELTLGNDYVDVEVVHPITCYKDSLQSRTVWTPRLVLPKPSKMAFVIFRTAIVLFSLARVEESPSSQLALETDSLPPPFQDCVDFRDQGYQIKGLGIEDQGPKHKYPSCVIMVEKYGVIRVITYPQKESEDTPQPAIVTAKSKIEQAIFYGTLHQNPLDFSARDEQTFTMKEINDAALEIQNEILNSTSKFLPTVTPSLEHQLRLRAKALEDLAVHLKRQYPPLPRRTRWLLLAGAEKMTACRALWKNQETLMKTKPEDEKTLLALMLGYIHENHKSLIDPAKGENDQVRHWFTHDTRRAGLVIAWSFQALREAYKDGMKSQKDIVSRISEANDIFLSTVPTAFQFRQANASLYGLGEEDLSDGVLGKDFDNVPEFWTTANPGLKLTKELVRTVQNTVDHDYSQDTGEQPTPAMVDKIRHDSSRLVETYSQMVDERSRWSLAQDNAKIHHEGEELLSSQVNERREMILKVGDSGLVEEAIALAVKYKDMETLVELLTVTIGKLHTQLATPGLGKEESDRLKAQLGIWDDELSSYFGKFGDAWAQALFTRQINDGLLGSILHQSQYQRYLTSFFERNPGYEKLGWINDVIGESNYKRASELLNNLAVEEQSNAWSKKVELSMGKLAELATIEDRYKGDATMRVENSRKATKDLAFKRQVALLDIQDLLYNHVQPSLRTAIDEIAEVQLANEQFAAGLVKGFLALTQLLQKGLACLVAREVMSAEQIIDVLTLMDTVYNGQDDESDVVGHEFYLALRCLDLADLDPARENVLEKIIWRRCMIRDDWIAINKTVKKDDAQIEAETDATALFRTLKEGFQNSLYPTSSLPDYEFHPLAPSATLGAATEPDAFRARFTDNDTQIRELLAEDVKKEDQLLKKYMEKGRLEKWFPGIVEAARKAVRDEADERGAEIGVETSEVGTGTGGDGGKEGGDGGARGKGKGMGVKLVMHGRMPDGDGDVSMS